MKRLALFAFTTLFALPACGGDEPIDQELLDQYRQAIPGMDQLHANAPDGAANALVGDPALYPVISRDIVVGINGSIEQIITIMRTVVMQPPTLYNSATQEFLWGPFPNNDGYGTIAAYVRDAGETEDFRYHYALLRGVDNDIAAMVPVIWGGANPDAINQDHGSGITMWDFTANAAFEQANNPDPGVLDSGRFIAVYGKGVDGGAEIAIAVAAFRDFVSKDNPQESPVDLDYLYGRVTGADGTTLDFIDWAANIDIDDDPARAAAEDVGVRLTFVNEGMGRAEADATGGDLEVNQVATAVECWDDAITENYILLEVTGGTNDFQFSDGDPVNCGFFQEDLTTLGIPSLADVPVDLSAALDRVATTGIPAE